MRSEDLISREKAYEVLTEYYHHKTELQHKALREALDMVPPVDIDLSDYSDRLWRKAYEQGKADAEPERKRGKWQEDTSGYGFWICSNCGFVSEASGANILYIFCPHCGAEMEKGEADDTD